MRKKLIDADIKVGSKLPWDLASESGRVLFKKGFSIHNEAALERLRSMELFYNDEPPETSQKVSRENPTATDEPERVTAFAQFDLLAERLRQTFDSIIRKPADCRKRLDLLVDDTRQLYARHPSTCIAAIHFRHEQSFASLHPLYSVFLVELLAEALGCDDNICRTISAAAMTANLGMYEFHDQWSDQEAPLDDTQKAQLRDHPRKTVQRLRACGVNDELWLRIAEDHHERNDGSGYPAGLTSVQLQSESLVINLIDRYLSFVMPRRYRKPQHPTAALKIIYEDAEAHGKPLVSTLIKQIGVYPPGTPVKLTNGEIAVVTRHEVSRAAHPYVASIGPSENNYFQDPVARDTYDKQFKVRGPYHYDPDTEPQHPASRIRNWG